MFSASARTYPLSVLFSRYVLFLMFEVADLRAPELEALLRSGKLVVRTDPEVFELATLADAHAKCDRESESARVFAVGNIRSI